MRRPNRFQALPKSLQANFLLSVAVALSLLGFPAPSAQADSGQAPFRRIVSINLAADELILQLADPEHILALSRLVFDPELSRLADRAARFPSTAGSVEHVLRLEPDIVFASQYTLRLTVDLLEQMKIRVVRLPEANDLEAARELVRQVADILQVEERGTALIRDMDERLSGLREKTARRGTRPTALLYGQGGYIQGEGTLSHHILEAAGLTNHAPSFGRRGQGELPLERLLLSPPDFLILLPYYEDDATIGSLLVRHRALRQLPDRMRIVEVPLGWTLTGNNLSARTAELLWEQTDGVLGQSENPRP